MSAYTATAQLLASTSLPTSGICYLNPQEDPRFDPRSLTHESDPTWAEDYQFPEPTEPEWATAQPYTQEELDDVTIPW
jgi:hypothetical protein